MAILYTTIIYKENKILCEVTDFFGNLQQACKSLVKVLKKEYKGTFCYEEKYYFHYLDEKNITYICLSDSNYPIDIAHYYLLQVKDLLTENFNENQIKISDMLGIESILKGKIIQKKDFFNQDHNSLLEIKNKLVSEDSKYNSVITIGKFVIYYIK